MNNDILFNIKKDWRSRGYTFTELYGFNKIELVLITNKEKQIFIDMSDASCSIRGNINKVITALITKTIEMLEEYNNG